MNKKQSPSILFIARSDSRDQSAYTQRLQNLANGIRSRGIKTDFIYLNDRMLTSHTMLPIYLPMLNRLMRKYDCVHAGGPSGGFVANLCKSFTGTKIITDFHGDRIGEILQEMHSGNDMERLSLFKTYVHEIGATYFSNYIITSSAPLKSFLMTRGISENRIFIVRSGVDISLFSPSSKKSDLKLTVTYAGQFQAYQAVDDLVDAFKHIINDRLQLKIIGFTKEDQRIKETIWNKLNGRVQLVDRLPQDRLAKHLQESDVLVIPRRRSRVTSVAFPTKFAEYIALGKPVISANVDETADFIRQYKCGFVYEPGVDGLVKILMRINSIPKEQLKQMGRKGRELAETFFDWNIVCDKYYDILRNLIYRK